MPPDLIRDRCEGLKGNNTGKLEFLNHEILFERTGKVLNFTKPEVEQAITQRCVNTGSKVTHSRQPLGTRERNAGERGGQLGVSKQLAARLTPAENCGDHYPSRRALW